MNKVLLLMLLMLLAGGANNSQLYAWGHYEDLIYQFHNDPGSVEPLAQIAILQRDIAKAQAINKKVAPGIYAHLGMLYSSVGDNDQAKAALEQEALLFPEAQTFINGLLERLSSTK